jgi:hypothetical protein
LAERQALAEQFEQAFEFYRKHDWLSALHAFRKLAEAYPEDTATQVYVERCEEFRKNDPGVDGTVVIRLNK